MIVPDIRVLMDKMDSRYTLVVTAAKRARQIVEGSAKLTKYDSDKAVTVAIHELAEGKIAYSRKEEGAPELLEAPPDSSIAAGDAGGGLFQPEPSPVAESGIPGIV